MAFGSLFAHLNEQGEIMPLVAESQRHLCVVYSLFNFLFVFFSFLVNSFLTHYILYNIIVFCESLF